MKRKKLIFTLACTTMVVSFAACGNTMKKDNAEISSETSFSERDTENENVQIPNPWVDCENLEEAEKITGFSFKIPEEIEGYSDIFIQVMNDELIQVTYQDDESEETVVLRKGRSSDDVSGDYNKYEESKQTMVNEYQVTEKGNDGKVMLATWTNGDDSYSVNTSGMSAEAIEEIIQQVI